MTKGASVDVGALLRDMLAATNSSDLAALRSSRLGSLPKARKRAFDDMLEALDGLMFTLDNRSKIIESGAPLPPPPPSQVPSASDTIVVPAITDDMLAEAGGLPLVGGDEIVDHSELETQIISIEPDDEVIEPPELPPTPPPPPTDRLEIPAEIAEPTPGWARNAELLFDDALRLFRIGDSDGALISLERLLASVSLNNDLEEFIAVNEQRLLDLYHAILGPWEKVPVRVNDTDVLHSGFFGPDKIHHVLELVDGQNSLWDIMDASRMSKLESIAVVSQLLRTRAITTEVTTH